MSQATRERALVPVLLFLGLVVSVVSSLGAPLLPRLAVELDASMASTQWALTVTVLVAAVSSPLIGRLGDGPHRKRVIVGCMSAVVVGGVLAALAGSLPVLIAGRGLQGFGLALMPLTMAVAREHLPAQQATRAIAGISVVGAAGVGLGYPITGAIADTLDVAAAYWFGTAVSAVALLLAALVVPQPRRATRGGRIDLPGAVLGGAGILALLVAMEKAPDWGWAATSTIGLFGAGVALMAVWTLQQLRVSAPLVDLRLLRRRAVLTGNVVGLLLGVVMYLTMVLITQFVQQPEYGLGTSVFVAGLTLVPMSLFSGLASGRLPALQARYGLRAVISAGALMIAVAGTFFALTGDALWEIFVTMGLIGLGIGVTFAALPGLIVGSVPPGETGSAMGFYQVSRYAGFAVGSGLAITLLRAFGDDGMPTLAAYQHTALVAAGLGVACAVAAWVLPGRGEPPVIADPEFEFEEGVLGAAGLEDVPVAATR